MSDPATELAEAVCKALGTSLQHYMPTTKRDAVAVVGEHLAAKESLMATMLEALEDALEQLREYELAATGEDYNCTRINAAIRLAKGDDS